jgi:hypothetical protein
MPSILTLSPLSDKSDPVYLQLPIPAKKRFKTVEDKSRKTAAQSQFVRCMEARAMIGGRSLLERAERAGWIRPVCRGKRMTLFKRADVEACIARIGWGELP